MSNNYITVAELVATMNLDASMLMDGMEGVRVKLQDIEPKIYGSAKAVQMLATQFVVAAEDTQKLRLALSEMWQARQNDAAAEKQRAVDSKAAMVEQAAVAKDYASLLKQLRAEELEGEKLLLEEKTAERRRYVSTWSILLKQQDEERKAQLAFDLAASESSLEQQKIMAAEYEEMWVRAYAVQSNAARTAGKGVTQSMYTSRLEAMALNDILGTKIPWALSGLVSKLPAVSAALASAFDVIVAVAFIDILVDVAKRMYDMTDAMNGFDAASKKAWDTAREGAIATDKAMLDIQIRQDALTFEKMKEVGPARSKSNAQIDEMRDLKEKSRIHQEILTIQERNMGIQKEIGILDKAKERTKDISVGGILTGKAGQLGGYIPTMEEASLRLKMYQQDMTYAKLKEEALRNTNYLRELGLKEGEKELQILKDHNKEYDRKHASAKKMHDEVHELPYRMPWFMGESPAQSFARQMQGGGAGTSGKHSDVTNMPSIARSLPAMGDSAPAHTGSSGGGGAHGSSAKIEINYSYQFCPTFEGVPADIEAFARNKMEPMIAKDLKDNTKGFTADVIDGLRKHGVLVK